MEKILIGTIGGKKGYKVAKYKFEDFEQSTEYALEVIAKKIKPDNIYIIGTKDSGWEIPDSKFNKYEKIYIPFGVKEGDYWETFDTLINNINVENKEIYLDITHGFRSLPFFIFTVLNFFEKVKGARIKALYYANFEYGDESTTKPIVDLLPVIELNKWIEGYFLFNKYGDTSYLSKLLSKFYKNIPDSYNKDFQYINTASEFLANLNISYGFSDVTSYEKYLKDIKTNFEEHIDKLNTIKSLRPIKFLFDNIDVYADTFILLDKEYKKQLELAKDYYHKNRFAQSISMLRESLLTFILEELGVEYKDKDYREKVLGAFLANHDNAKRYLNYDFVKLVNDVKRLRNKIDHCYIIDSSVKVLEEAEKNKIKTFLDKAEHLMRANTIKHKEALKKELEDLKEKIEQSKEFK